MAADSDDKDYEVDQARTAQEAGSSGEAVSAADSMPPPSKGVAVSTKKRRGARLRPPLHILLEQKRDEPKKDWWSRFIAGAEYIGKVVAVLTAAVGLVAAWKTLVEDKKAEDQKKLLQAQAVTQAVTIVLDPKAQTAEKKTATYFILSTLPSAPSPDFPLPLSYQSQLRKWSTSEARRLEQDQEHLDLHPPTPWDWDVVEEPAPTPSSSVSASVPPAPIIRFKPKPKPKPDADGDGIPDDQDKCPNEKEDGKPKDPSDGCPSPCWDQAGYNGCMNSCNSHCDGDCNGNPGCMGAWCGDGEARIGCHRSCEGKKNAAITAGCWSG